MPLACNFADYDRRAVAQGTRYTYVETGGGNWTAQEGTGSGTQLTTCDGLDNDCSGAADEDFTLIGLSGAQYSGVNTLCGVGRCSDNGTRTACNVAKTGIQCNYAAGHDAIAEDCGLIDRVFDHVLETAMRQLVEWQGQLSDQSLAMSVNLSSKQLRHQGLVDLLLGRLAAAGLPPESLEIEITESALMEDPQLALQILTQLHTAGIGIAIDDFGTGFSSLSYLSRLPVSSLKIDRSFVLEMTKDTGSNIVGFVVDLAKHLKLQVVAEGVEQEDDVSRLVAHGCGYAQGYLFSRPLAAADMSLWLSDYRAVS